MASKYKQQADGRWHTRVWDGTYRNGNKHYVQLVSAKSSKDLERIVTEFVVKREQGLITVSSAMGIQEYAQGWMRVEKGQSQKATKDMYHNIINVHLKEFKGIPFDRLTRQKIQILINDNMGSPRTCQQILMCFKQICKSAENDKLLPTGATAELFYKIQAPKYKAEKKKPLSIYQCEIVYNALVTHKLPPRSALFLALIYFCGLRREEALALKYNDICNGVVDVNKALHISDRVTEVKATKTTNGERSIPLPPKAIPIIEEALAELPHSSDGFLFTTRDGKLITKSSYVKMWESIKKALGFECTAHIFRHTYCTRLCYESYKQRTISIKKIAELLGDTEKMVSDVYGHLWEEEEETDMALEHVFENKKKKNSPKPSVAITEVSAVNEM